MMIRSALSLAAATAILSGCGDDAPPAETEVEAERNAKGEVIGGTISDAMIPLDRLRSQSPPVREAPSQPSAAGPASDAPAAPEEASEPAPAPAAAQEAGDDPAGD
jgi:hypothetical protein